jgi:EVE domain-containing protein
MINSWLFQGNPKYYKIRPALHHFKATSTPTTWLVKAHKAEISTGDEVFFWEAGAKAGLVGWGEVQTEPARIPLEEEELQFVVVKTKFDGPRLRVRIKVEGECYRSRTELRSIDALRTWTPVRRGVEGTNFRIPTSICERLRLAVTGQI